MVPAQISHFRSRLVGIVQERGSTTIVASQPRDWVSQIRTHRPLLLHLKIHLHIFLSIPLIHNNRAAASHIACSDACPILLELIAHPAPWISRYYAVSLRSFTIHSPTSFHTPITVQFAIFSSDHEDSAITRTREVRAFQGRSTCSPHHIREASMRGPGRWHGHEESACCHSSETGEETSTRAIDFRGRICNDSFSSVSSPRVAKVAKRPDTRQNSRMA